MTTSVRFAVRVKPNAKHNRVGGARGEALLVAVAAPAVDGKANDAVIRALATAFGVRRQQVHIVSGLRARDKLVELDPAPPEADQRLAELLRG